jgi:8-oxo-dGTP diphosphatase
MKYLMVVALALENETGEILMVQRPATTTYPFYWEFPGGKIEENETPEMALCREIFEELNLIIQPENLTPVRFATQLYSHAHVTILLFKCRQWQGKISLKEGQPAYQWVQPNQLKDLKMPEGNYKFLDKII